MAQIGAVVPKKKKFKEESHNVFIAYYLDDPMKEETWTGQISMHWAIGNVQHILVTKYEMERLLERPKSRWEDNIKVDLEYMNVRCGLNSCEFY
jgi:hypothetical protein